MPVSITPLLADRLDISEERARSLLQTMLRELRRRAESEGVRLPELGTFREEGGTLTFVPSPSLRRRINRKYEGLTAEELSAPSEPPSPAVSELDVEEEPSGDGPDDGPTPTPVEVGDDARSEQEPVPSSEPPPSSQGRTIDSFSIIGLVLAFLFLLGAGWFVLDRTNVLAPGPDPGSDLTAEQTSPPPDTGSPSDTASSERPEPDAEETSDSDVTAPPVKDWAIVVASRSSRAAAEAAAEEYRTRFDSVSVVEGTVDGQAWHRVAIGWYPSEAAAERALDEQASALPPGAWIHRLR
jgi:cell division septation protein DedD